MGYVGAAAAIIGALTSAGTAIDQRNTQKRNEKRQDQAQKKAEGEAASAKRASEMDNANARKKSADIVSILDAEQTGADLLSRARLSGNEANPLEAVRLGASSLLGE